MQTDLEGKALSPECRGAAARPVVLLQQEDLFALFCKFRSGRKSSETSADYYDVVLR